MNRAEREILIERYMNAEMSSAEESDFFIQVALDRELRQELKAQRVIESALRKDLEAEPTEHTAMRARVASILAASSNAPMRASMPMAAPMPRTGGTERKRSRWGLIPVQWMIASGVALALTAGTAVVLPSGKSDIPLIKEIPAAHVSKAAHGSAGIEAPLPAAPAPASPARPADVPRQHAASEEGSVLRDSRPVHSKTPAAGVVAERSSINLSSRPASRERRIVNDGVQSPKREEVASPVHTPANDGPINVGVTIEIQKKKIE
ncbi:MAG TPA: hypothetical protein VHI13_20925 [Candidatus Kapabacteria bacterium]|nr:hypothetical protein [Candidatus Kapabacteria bacterium]